MRLSLVLFIIGLLFAVPLLSQSRFGYGLEAGMSVSEFPKKWNHNDGTAFTRPIPSPVIGVTGVFKFAPRFSLSQGIDYMFVASKRDAISYGSFMEGENTYEYTRQVWEMDIFHKISMPLRLNLLLNIKDFKFSLFAGYNLNVVITARDYYRCDYIVPDYDEKNRYTVIDYNPANKNETQLSLNRLSSQISLGMSFYVTPNLSVNLISEWGIRGFYYDYVPLDWDIYFDFYYFHGGTRSNNNFILSATYFLK